MLIKTLIPLDATRSPITVAIEWDRWGNMFAWLDIDSATRRLITPFELRVRYQLVQLTFQDVLDTYLPLVLQEEIIKPELFLKFIKCDTEWKGATYNIPIEYGVTFNE